MKKIYRMLACVLVVAMVFSSLPMSALAATVQEQEITSSAETSSQSSEEEASSEENQSSVQSEDETSSQEDAQTPSDEEDSPSFDNFTVAQPDVSIGVENGENASDVQATGTAISTPEELLNISDDLSGSYYLANDIDMSGVAFTPIGPSSSSPFTGTFDGNEHVIKNLTFLLLIVIRVCLAISKVRPFKILPFKIAASRAAVTLELLQAILKEVRLPM